MADLASPALPALTPATVDVTADLALVYDTSVADMRQMTVRDLLYAHQGWINVPDATTLNFSSNFGHNVRFETTITTNRTLGTPVNPIDGAIFTLRIKQGGAGGNLLSLVLYIVPSDIATTLSTAVGMTDFLTAVYVAGPNKWVVLALTKGASGL